eukprot:CFRG8259T1
MKFTLPSLMHLAGLTAYLARTGCDAAPAEAELAEFQLLDSTPEVTSITIHEGELNEINARARAKHSLSTWEWNHMKQLATLFKNEKGNFQYSARNSGATDEYSVIPGDADECLILIAGTDSFGEWISNVDFPLETLSSGGDNILRGHQGFVKAAKAIDSEGLTEKINAHCGSRSAVTFAGHSRGGGIAQILASVYHHRNSFNTVRLVSWGSPRALSDSSANNFHNTFYQVRVVNDNDPVTTQPTRNFGYRHMGTVVCINCKNTNQDASGGFSLNAKAHSMDTYEKKIRSITV